MIDKRAMADVLQGRIANSPTLARKVVDLVFAAAEFERMHGPLDDEIGAALRRIDAEWSDMAHGCRVKR